MSLFSQVCLVCGAYLLGSIPFALVIGRARGIDIRRTGSGNVGATNLARALGRKWGILAFLCDYAKGLAPVLLASLFARAPAPPAGPAIITGMEGVRSERTAAELAAGASPASGPSSPSAPAARWLPVAAGAAAVLGHVFPIYLRFRGGKGVATAFGVMTGLSWPATAAAGALWLIIYFTTRTVSIASLAAAVALPAGVAAFGQLGLAAGYGAVLGFAVLLALIIIVRHRTNIARLLRGEELGFRKETAVGAASAGEGGAPAHGNSAVSGGFQGEKQ